MLRRLKNIVVNKFKEFTEICVYNETFITSKKELIDRLYSEQDKEISLNKGEEIENIRGRKFKYNEFGELVPIGDSDIKDLEDSIYKSQRRSIDKFIGYALANNWSAFLTLTCSQEILDTKKLDRYKDDDVKYLWSLFRKKLNRISPNVKFLCVPEPHKDGALHFHVLVSDFNFVPYIELSPKISNHGNKLYNINRLWEYGFSTVALINVNESQQALTFYLQKYMKKSFNCNYNKRRFYASRNLNSKSKYIGLVTEEKLQKILYNENNEKIELYKTTDKMTVYKLYRKTKVE